MKDRLILAVNPGEPRRNWGSSGMMSRFRGKHPSRPSELEPFGSTFDQMNFRRDIVLAELNKRGYSPEDLTAVVGRGGTFKPLASGTYAVNERLLQDIREGTTLQADHPSNLGAPIAGELLKRQEFPPTSLTLYAWMK